MRSSGLAALAVVLPLALPLVLPLTLAGCIVSVDYDRTSREEPILESETSQLQPGKDDLAGALARLGAPTQVYECSGQDVAVAYAFEDNVQWGFAFGIPLRNGLNASYRWGRDWLDVPGVVLVFDGALVLRSVRRGRLDEIARELGRPKRPSTPE